GTPLLRPSQQSVASLAVSTSLLPASASGPGPLLSLVPKSGSRVWTGGTEARFISAAMQADADPRDAVPIAKFDDHQEWVAHAGGRLGSMAGLFVTGRRVASDRVEPFDPDPLATHVTSVYASADLQNARGQIRLNGSVDRTGMPYLGRA